MLNNLLLAGPYFPADGQTVKFDWLSIVYLVILVIAVIVGIKKGLISTLLSLFGVVIAGLVAYYSCVACGKWLASINGWGDAVEASINTWLVDKSEMANLILDKTTATAQMPNILTALSIPSFVQGYVGDFVISIIPDVATLSIGAYIAKAVAELFFTSVSFLIIFLLLIIVVAILKHFTKNLNKVKVVGAVNRIFGGVLGLAIGAIFVIVISFGLSAVAGMNTQVYDWLSGTLYLAEDNVWSIGKMIYTNNFLGQLLGYFGK